ncbi:unnamed protein product, partial [Urochloa humidicola]
WRRLRLRLLPFASVPSAATESSPPPADSPVFPDTFFPAVLSAPVAAPDASTASSPAATIARNRMKLGKHWKMPSGRRRQSLTNGMWKLKGGGIGAGLEVLLLVVEDGQEEADGSGGLPAEISGMQQNRLFLQSLGIIAAFFLIANFNVLIAAVINSLLLVLRLIRRTFSFIARCVFQNGLV